MELFDVIVVRAASAGLTAALYTSRQGLKTLVISKDMGGQALLTGDIQNYPGFLTIGGFELMNKFEEQAKHFGAEFAYDEVQEVRERDGVCFTVKTPNGEYGSCVLILAFGKTPRDLGVSGEQNLKGKGVSYCAICDGPLFKRKTVAVIGSGDPAMEAADLLAQFASKVYLVYQWSRIIGDEELITRLKNRGNVVFIPSSRVTEIKGDSKVESILLQNAVTEGISEVALDGVFVELGYVPRTEFVRNLVQLNAKGEIVVDKEAATSHHGIFAAGDVTDTPYKQAVVSAGQGAVAALSAYNYVQKMRGKAAVRADWKVLSIKAVAKE